MTVHRGTTNRNDRGNTRDRARRRAWLVDNHGDGEFVDCALAAVPECWVAMTRWSVSVDRIVPGAEGGKYQPNNIRAACLPCQSYTGGLLGAARKREKALVTA